MGTGVLGKLVFPPNYPREEVAKAGRSDMKEILSLGETGQENRIIDIMSEGTIRICEQLYVTGNCLERNDPLPSRLFQERRSRNS